MIRTHSKRKQYTAPNTEVIETEVTLMQDISEHEINDPTQPGGTTSSGISGTEKGNPPGDGAKSNPWSSWGVWDD